MRIARRTPAPSSKATRAAMWRGCGSHRGARELAPSSGMGDCFRLSYNLIESCSLFSFKGKLFFVVSAIIRYVGFIMGVV